MEGVQGLSGQAQAQQASAKKEAAPGLEESQRARQDAKADEAQARAERDAAQGSDGQLSVDA